MKITSAINQIKSTYDFELKGISPKLFMLPWIGDNFEKTRILFIGESEYDNGTIFHLYWKRDWIIKERVKNIETDSKLINNIDRTILGNSLDKESRQNLWNSIAFTNLVQRPMDWKSNKNDKPSYLDIKDGWHTILNTLVVLKPNLIIKWGIKGDGILRNHISNEFYKNWKYEKLSNQRFLSLKHNSGFATRLLFVHHPSWRFFSHVKMREHIYTSCPELSSILSLD